MKYMVISDIHGNIYNLNKVLEVYKKEHCDKLLILGDLFNYGIDLNRSDIINRLNLMRYSIISVRGNCDNNINDILFDMPYINNINLNNKNILLTHNLIYNNDQIKNLDIDIIFVGHTHIADIREIDDKLIINPGSISKSRRGDNSFIIVDDNNITIRNLDNEILQEKNIA